jgi:hypothetical protein
MLDIELALWPIKPQYAGAADEAIQIWSIQCVVNAKGLISHGTPSLWFARNELPVRLLDRSPAISIVKSARVTWAERFGCKRTTR